MSPDVLHFQCAACQATLTVPVHLAGITGPCPKCGATVTSPPAPAPEPLAVPPMPSMTPPLYEPMPQPVQEPVAIPQPQSYPPPPQPQAAMGSWGGQELSQPQEPAAHMPPQPLPAAQTVSEIPPSPMMLPPRRGPGQAPAAGSLMNQQAVGGGFGPVANGLANPSPAPQWNFPTGSEPPPMPQREVEDPMTTILRGTGVPTSSEPGSDPRNLAAHAAPSQTPVSMPRAAMDVQLGGKRKGGGKVLATLAAVLFVGALGTAGWFFQEPIKDLAGRFMPSSPEGTTEEPPIAPDEKPPVTANATTATQAPRNETTPFDPLAKPAQGLPVEKPAPIIVEAAPPGIAGTPAPAVPGIGVPLPVGTAPSLTAPEINPAAAPNPPVSMPLVPVVPKATIVEDGTDGTAPPSVRHVPGTALGKKGGASDSLIEVTPANPPAVPSSGGGTPSTTTTDMTKTVVVQATPEAKRAAEALQAFFAASNLGERMPLTLGAENMKSLMERYYAKKDSGIIDVDEIKLLRFDPAPDTGGGPHCVFTVASKLWQYPIPVMLQEESGTYKVDWLAFVEFRDNLLFEFLSDYQEMPARFHVGIRRTHYFEDDVPDLAEKDCFEIQPPLPTYVGYVFVPKGTPLAADLASRISWETLTAYVIVELRWKRLGEMKWVELTAVPQLNWYSFPQTAQGGSPPAPTEPGKKSGTGGVNVKKATSKASGAPRP